MKRHLLSGILLVLLTGVHNAPFPDDALFPCEEQPPRLSYTIRPAPDGLGLLIDGRLEGASCNRLVFRHADQVGPHPLALIRHVAFRDDDGPVPTEEAAGGVWRLPPVRGTLRFTYRVRTGGEAHTLPRTNVWRTVMPYADPHKLYLTRYAFLWPRGIPPRVPVRLLWDVPPTWQIVTPWPTRGQTTTVPNLYGLLKNYYAAFEGGSVMTRRIGETDVTVAWTGPDRLEDRPDALPALEKVFRRVQRLEPGAFGPRLLILFHDTADHQALTGATAGTSSLQLQFPRGAPLAAVWPYAHTSILRTVAHELLHTWSYRHERDAPPYPGQAGWATEMCWMREGVTEYLAHRTLLEAGLLSPAAFAENLERISLRLQQLDPSGAWTLEAACRQYYDDDDAFFYTYARGMLMAHELDMALRVHTGEGKTLEGFMRQFIAAHRGKEKTLAVFRQAWAAYAPVGLPDPVALLHQPTPPPRPFTRASRDFRRAPTPPPASPQAASR